MYTSRQQLKLPIPIVQLRSFHRTEIFTLDASSKSCLASGLMQKFHTFL
uniref:Uncharacterized protein n=1 Tax=Arundo donax TaxID=35708 RepID=A0A0A9AXA4_ARUDO